MIPNRANRRRNFSLIGPSTGSEDALEITSLPIRSFEPGRMRMAKNPWSAIVPFAASSAGEFRLNTLDPLVVSRLTA
jgi:hypothetical protein